MAFWAGDGARTNVRKQDLQWIGVPPKTGRIILTDRADGTLWVLSYSTTPPAGDGLGYIAIDDVIPTSDKGNYHIYPPYDGPMVGWVTSPQEHSQGVDPKPNVYARLLVRAGYLGF